MEKVKSCLITLSREFGTRIDYDVTPEMEAVGWLIDTLNDRRSHTEVKIQSCNIRPFEITGVKRIDKMLTMDFVAGFSAGNTYTDLQSSSMVPAANVCRVNGTSVIDGKQLTPGDLQEKALAPFLLSKWNTFEDLRALKQIQNILESIDGDTSTTIFKIKHPRAGTAESNVKKNVSPTITNGWLLIDDQNKLLFRHDHSGNKNGPGKVLMDRAAQVLTCEHTDAVTLLEISGGKITFVDDYVLKEFDPNGNAQTRQKIEAFTVNPIPGWQREQHADERLGPSA